MQSLGFNLNISAYGLSTPFIADALSVSAGSIKVLSAPLVQRIPLCGNQLCETGEVCTQPNCTTGCVLDCGPTADSGALSCPMGLSPAGDIEECCGAGDCQPLSGLCACIAGRVGSACEACDASYIRVGGNFGMCVYVPDAMTTCRDGLKDGNEAGVDCGGSCPPCHSSSGMDVGMLIGTCSAALVALALVVFVVYRGWRRANLNFKQGDATHGGSEAQGKGGARGSIAAYVGGGGASHNSKSSSSGSKSGKQTARVVPTPTAHHSPPAAPCRILPGPMASEQSQRPGALHVGSFLVIDWSTQPEEARGASPAQQTSPLSRKKSVRFNLPSG